MKKRGYIFSTDALIAIVILLSVAIVISPIMKARNPDVTVPEDILKSFSSMNMEELDSAYARQLIADKKIEPNKSILEAISELYAKDSEEARIFSENLLQTLSIKDNVGIWLDNQYIASINSSSFENSERVWVSSEIISGIESGKEVKGFSSRAFLKNTRKVKYFYFGGYVGDGNISIEMNLTGEIGSAEIEAAFGKSFELYINNNPVGNYSSLGGETPLKINLNSHLSNFIIGKNKIDFKGNNVYISGGYIKIEYDDENPDYGVEKKYLPGIEGMINIYDSFYIPSQINQMSLSLHYMSPYNLFVTIGNRTIFRGNSSAEKTEVIDNVQLSSLLNYQALAKKTIPLRIGLDNVSYNLSLKKYLDAVLVTDTSGSMDECGLYANPYVCSYSCFFGGAKSCLVSNPADCTGNVCGGNCFFAYRHSLVCEETKLDLAKGAANEFVDAILIDLNNKIGLVNYGTSVLTSGIKQLTNSSPSLKTKIDSYISSGNTCICCGINSAAGIVKNSTRIKAILVMSDGEANQQCSQQGTGNAKQDAIQAACDAYEDYNITVHAVGFGNEMDNVTMIDIAECGHGNYSSANSSSIAEIYKNIAKIMLEAAYYEQTLSGENIFTKIFPDSFISFDYIKNETSGLIINLETAEFGNNISVGNFTIPIDAEVVEAKILSYSGSRWTSLGEVYNNSWQAIFNLSEYGKDYTQLGDPYSVDIPVNKISKGVNSVKIRTSIGYNASGGSEHDKVAYRIVKPSLGYSEIVASASGCSWTIEFEDNTNISISIPKNYTGGDSCYYMAGNIAYNTNDAIDTAVFNLFSNLDLDGNGKIETKLSEGSVEIDSSDITGIPYSWSGDFSVRVWR